MIALVLLRIVRIIQWSSCNILYLISSLWIDHLPQSICSCAKTCPSNRYYFLLFNLLLYYHVLSLMMINGQPQPNSLSKNTTKLTWLTWKSWERKINKNYWLVTTLRDTIVVVVEVVQVTFFAYQGFRY